MKLRPILSLLTIFAGIVSGTEGRAQGALPSGFYLEQVGYGPFFAGPTGFALLPDGRVLMIERSGRVRLGAVGALSSAWIDTVADVSTAGGGERGLLGVAVDPAWPTRPYLYFYYSHASGTVWITMFEATGDLTAPASTNLSLGEPYHLLTDIPDVTDLHQAGTLRFGPDGMLYASLGDDAWGCSAQDLTRLSGEILRLDVAAMPGAGSGPPPKADITPTDNPFPGPDENEKLVYAWGARNPFRFTIDAATGDLFFGDVGTSFYEEINRIPGTAGGGENFGWPRREGFFDSGNPFPCGEKNVFTDPVYAYAHPGIASVICGPLYRHAPFSPESLPASYEGSLFVLDFFQGWIRRLVPDGALWVIAPPVPGQPSAENWGQGFLYFSDFQLGADGALYLCRYLDDFAPNGVFRIYQFDATGIDDSTAEAGSAVRVSPNPALARQGLEFRWTAARAGDYSVEIFDARGRSVRRLKVRATAGLQIVRWDGLTSAGVTVGAGVYFYRLRGNGSSYRGKFSILN